MAILRMGSIDLEMPQAAVSVTDLGHPQGNIVPGSLMVRDIPAQNVPGRIQVASPVQGHQAH